MTTTAPARSDRRLRPSIRPREAVSRDAGAGGTAVAAHPSLFREMPRGGR